MALYFDTEIGRIGVYAPGEAIVEIRLNEQGIAACESPSPLEKEAGRQLRAYFQKRLRTFDLPVHPEGTDFMRTIWKTLCKVPFGETVSYGWLAAASGYPGAARAVGQAMHRNPIPIVIPCHRVVGAGGHLTGFGGGMEIKCALLALEGVEVRNLRLVRR